MARVLDVLRARGMDVPDEAADAVVLTEVALIRDAYKTWMSSDLSSHMDKLVELVAGRGPHTHTPWSQLAPVLRDPKRTYPTQVIGKADRLSIGVGPEGTLPGSPQDEHNRTVYEALQGVFSAKPDLALVLRSKLIVFEAKLTEDADDRQFERTQLLAELWASPLLRGDLGYTDTAPPSVSVARLGDEGTEAKLTWQDLHRIALERYPPNDRTCIALGAVVRLLSERRRPARRSTEVAKASAGEPREMRITQAALQDVKARVAERLRSDTAFEDGKVEALDGWMEPLPPTAEAWARELRRRNVEPWAYYAAAWLLREAAPTPGPTEIVLGDLEVGPDEVRVIPGNLRVEGHLRILGTLLVLGDAEVTGLVRDGDPDSRVAIAGTLRCGSLVTDGAFFVGGDLVAKDLIHGFGKDRALMVSGGIRARLFLGECHDIRFSGDLETELGSNEDFFENEELLDRVRLWLVDEVVDAKGLRRDALIACLREGRSIFRRR